MAKLEVYDEIKDGRIIKRRFGSKDESVEVMNIKTIVADPVDPTAQKVFENADVPVGDLQTTTNENHAALQVEVGYEGHSPSSYAFAVPREYWHANPSIPLVFENMDGELSAVIKRGNRNNSLHIGSVSLSESPANKVTN